MVDRRIGFKAMETTSGQVNTRRGHQDDHDTQRQLLHAEYLRLRAGRRTVKTSKITTTSMAPAPAIKARSMITTQIVTAITTDCVARTELIVTERP